MIKKLSLCLYLFLFILISCQRQASDLAVETPPIIEAAPEVEPTQPPPTIATEPDLPTAVSTSVIEEIATPVINTPEAPPTQLVDTIQLASILPAGQLFKPVYLSHAFNNRLFIVEQAGTIRIIENGFLMPEPFLDIQNRVNSEANEQGLLSVAFHPAYAENGRFFVNYTSRDGSTVIASFQVKANNPHQADPASEQTLLTIGQPYNNHNGGQIKFGPDGYLYIGMGDGGSADDPDNNGQTFTTLLGNMLRIDVNSNSANATYAIPASNPFVNNDAIRNEIWATGLRNPWRFSFDRLSGDLFITDVGQNEWEELNHQSFSSPGAENYGWNLFEGAHCFTSPCDPNGLNSPVFEYNHSFGCSITGGYIYRGQQFAPLWGNYFLTDYCTGTVWALIQQADGSWASNIVLESGRLVASFGEDAQGELYMLDHLSGEVLQIQP